MKKRLSILLAALILAVLAGGLYVSAKDKPDNPGAKGNSMKVENAGNKNSEKPEKEKTKEEAIGLVYAGDVISVTGTGLKIKRATSPHWMNGRINMPNYISDVLETDENTIACVEFLDGSQIGINKKTVIEIISTSDAKDVTKRGTVEKIVLKSGALWAKITGRSSGTFKVQTNKGILGVKGTEFIVEDDTESGGEKVTVLEGEVAYSMEGTEDEEDITPGEEVTFMPDRRVERRRRPVKEIRNALYMRFPGLNPYEQAVVSIFAYRALHHVPGGYNALHVARETTYLIDNPEQYVVNRAVWEARRHTSLPIPGIRVNSGGSRRSDPNRYRVKNLSPRSETLRDYNPVFTWDKVNEAKSYRIIVSKRPLVKGEKSPGYWAYGVTKETEWKYPEEARALKPGMTYYWSVIPLNDKDKPIAIPSRPARIKMASFSRLGLRGLFPVGSIKPFRGDLVFDWTAVANAAKYKLELSGKESMEEILYTGESENNYHVVKDASLLLFKDRDYFWRVTPLDAEGNELSIARRINVFRIDSEKK